MAFDEDLQRAFEMVNGRLRDEIARVAMDVSASASADRDQAVRAALQDAEREAEERLSAAVAVAEAYAIERALEEGKRQREEGKHEGHVEGQLLAEQASAAAVGEAVAVARAELRAAELAATERLVDAIEAIGRGRSLTEILDTLVTSAARETARAAIIVMRDDRFRGWRFLGFGPAFDTAHRIEFGSTEAGLIGEAMRTGVVVASHQPPAVSPVFAELPSAGECVAIPLVMGGEVAAVLYADEGHLGGPGRQEGPAWTSTLNILARYAGRCLETITVFRAASVAAAGRAPAQTRPPAQIAAADGPGRDRGVDDASAAQRYARLLVSEIKLYHEADVIAGRRERDLMSRLGGEIARARGLYDQRVPGSGRQMTDHFHTELVRTLANGDESLLEVRART